MTENRNWRRVKEDKALEKHIMEFWRTGVMDTKIMSGILKVSEARIYNILSKRPAKRKPIAYAGRG